MPDDQPQSDDFYLSKLQESVAQSRAMRQQQERDGTPLPRRLEGLAAQVPDAPSALPDRGRISILGAVGDGRSFALPEPSPQPPGTPALPADAAVPRPFQILSQSGTEGGANARVYKLSTLFFSLKVNDTLDISGLDSDFTVAIGNKIWVQISVDTDVDATAATIVCQPIGGAYWDEFPNPVAVNNDDPDNPYQEYYNQIIAECVDPTDTSDTRPGLVVGSGSAAVKIVQLLDTNLILTKWAVAGLLAIVPQPWQAPSFDSTGLS